MATLILAQAVRRVYEQDTQQLTACVHYVDSKYECAKGRKRNYNETEVQS